MASLEHTATAPEVTPSSLLNAESTPPLSKNARKRIFKAERLATSKAERRARDKEKKKARAEKRRTGVLDAPGYEAENRPKRRKVEGPSNASKIPFKARIVVDLGFDDKMTKKEVVSLCSQLAYTYSSNRKSNTPFFNLLFTSLNGKTLARLNTLGDQYKRWQHVEFWEEGYERLWNAQHDECNKDMETYSRERVVYLTGDAKEELEELKEGETYIIGGICDRNRYKNLCLDKANGQSIRSARLPIGTYLEHLPTRKILTVNQVFDILVHWVEVRDWSKALHAVMPKRKFQQGSRGGGCTSDKDAQEQDEIDVDAESGLDQHEGPELKVEGVREE